MEIRRNSAINEVLWDYIDKNLRHGWKRNLFNLKAEEHLGHLSLMSFPLLVCSRPLQLTKCTWIYTAFSILPADNTTWKETLKGQGQRIVKKNTEFINSEMPWAGVYDKILFCVLMELRAASSNICPKTNRIFKLSWN